MNMKMRLNKLEKQAGYRKYLPVLFVDNEEEIKRHKSKIGSDTVIFVYDFEGADNE